MKLDKQGSPSSGDGPATLSIPQALASLPPLHVPSMSEKELQDLLLQLVAILQGLMLKRPDWWPHSTIPWSLHHLNRAVKNISLAVLCGLVTKCYSFLGQHSVMASPAQPRIPTQPRVLDWLNSNPPSRSCTLSAKTLRMSNAKQKGGMLYMDTFQSHQCDKELSTRDTLQKHQVKCYGGPLTLSISSTQPASEASSHTMVSDDRSLSAGTYNSAQPSRPFGVSFGKFVLALDLVPVHRAKKIRQARRHNTECETIDLEEPQTPLSPPTPRTPKLLISQLSRDASTNGTGGSCGSPGASCRRRLSYLRQSVDRAEDKGRDEESDDDDDDTETTGSGTEDADEPKLLKKSLFSIDVTSSLGQRVLKHMTAESHVPVISDSEQFCRTPIKDKYQDRLRTRQMNYLITWKLTRKRLRQQAHCHLYNFTRVQKFEFMEKMRTGLNWRCRKLLDCVKNCSVVVKRLSMKTLYKWKPSLNKLRVPLKQLTEKEIVFWTRPKPQSPVHSVYLEFPVLRLTDADSDRPLNSGNAHSELVDKRLSRHNVFDTVSGKGKKQKMAVGRKLLPHVHSGSLLKSSKKHGKVSSTQKSHPTILSMLSNPTDYKIRDNNIGANMIENDKKPLQIEIPPLSTGQSSVMNESTCSPLDDSFSIMTVSSSDEENIKSTTCCSLCAVRNRCYCSSERTASGTTSSLHSSHLHSAPSMSSEGFGVPSLQSVSPSSSSSVSTFNQAQSTGNLSLFCHGTRSLSQPPALTSSLSLKNFLPTSVQSFSSPLRASACPQKSLFSQSLREQSESPCLQSAQALSGYQKNKTSAGIKRKNGLKDKDLTEALRNRRSTRSSSKESTTSESNETLLKHATSVPSRLRVRKQKSASTLSLSRMAKKVKMFGAGSGLVSRRPKRVKSETFINRGICDSNQGNHLHKNRCASDNRHNIEKRVNTIYDGRRNHGICLALCASDAASVRTLSNSREDTNSDNRHTMCPNPKATGNSSNVTRYFPDNSFASSVDVIQAKNDLELDKGMYRTNGKIIPSSSAQNVTQNGNFVFKSRSSSDTNPFLLSKAQTQIFSSSILEQARRCWSPNPKSPTRDSVDMKLGNSCSSGKMTVGAPMHKFSTMVSSERTESFRVPSSSYQFHGSQTQIVSSKLSSVSPRSLGYTNASPSRARKRLSAMQMLSVLESTKRSSPSRNKGIKKSPARLYQNGVGDDHVSMRGSKRAGSRLSPVKKARLVN